MKVELLSAPACIHCAEVKKLLEELKPDFPALEVEEIEVTTPRGTELAQKYMVFSSPGIIINGELFATGGATKEQLREKLKTLSQKNGIIDE